MLKNLLRYLNKAQSGYYPFVPDEIDLRNRLPRNGLDELKVLNVGVGSGHSGLARQLPFFKFDWLVNIDTHQPYLDAARTRVYDAGLVSFINKDVRDSTFDGFDFVLMFDVLEHLPKEESLKIMDKIQCRQLIFIPLEKEFRENTFGAKSQDHLSFWTEEDFINRGYKTEVLKGFHVEGDNVFDALWAVK